MSKVNHFLQKWEKLIVSYIHVMLKYQMTRQLKTYPCIEQNICCSILCPQMCFFPRRNLIEVSTLNAFVKALENTFTDIRSITYHWRLTSTHISYVILRFEIVTAAWSCQWKECTYEKMCTKGNQMEMRWKGTMTSMEL